MRPIKQETNIEVLRQFSLFLSDEVVSLRKQLAEMREIQTAGADQQKLIQDQYHRLQTKFFGFGRETLAKDNGQKEESRPVGHAQQKLNLHNKRSASEECSDQEESKKPHPSAAALAKFYDFAESALEEENTVRGMAKGLGKKPWKKLENLCQESIEITVTERVYQRVVHRQQKYKLKDEYNTTGKEVIITAPGPVKIKAGSKYSVDFALSVVADKYEYHLPLERQRRKMEAAGLEIEVKTLYGLCESVAEHAAAILPAIKKDIQTEFVAVHLDESPWRILSTGTQGYMWVMSNRAGVYYQFEPTRSGKVPEEMMKDYQGAIVTDGYGGYNPLRRNPQIRVQHCWAHARREFFERIDDYPAHAKFAVGLIDMLFDVEAEATDFEHLRELRKTKSKPITEELKAFCFKTLTEFLPNEGITKAIKYVLGSWKELTHFLIDLSVPLSNNDAERALRHAVLGRKNFAGSKTINGADVAATLYTVIESCKKAGLQPNDYWHYLIEQRWHGQPALSPQQYAIAKFGPANDISWPQKDQWRI